MNYERATILQRIAAFLTTWMLTFAVTSLSSPLATTNTLLYISILLSYVTILCLFYAKASSPGKYIMKLQVISSTNNKPAKFLRMFYRETIGKLISSIFYIGYIYILFNKENLALHDLLCKTYVIKIKAE